MNAATQRPGSHTDCFAATVPDDRASSDGFARFVFLFFDSWLFRLELKILRLAGKAPATHSDALMLARGKGDRFAAWVVDEHRETELLLRVPDTPILTWLSCTTDNSATQLRFGSGILAQDGKSHPHWGFRATMRGHQFYSKALLHAAATDWERGKTLPN